MTARPPTMHQAHIQQIECLITLAEELHFGRTAQRLGLSQSRVSQLIQTLESRTGARLVDRTSRRVALTRVGAQFIADVEPSYRALARDFTRARERAMRGALKELRIGFTGMVYEQITATFNALHARHGVAVHTHDVPVGSPFTAVVNGDLDAVIAELPMHEAELTIGFRFPAHDQFIALGAEHPLASHDSITVEQLAELDVLHRIGDAPDYWKIARTPPATPSGAPIASTAGITTIQQGMALAASGRHAMLVCRPLTEHHARTDLRFVPVSGLENTSQLGLIWRTDRASPPLTALAELLGAETRVAPGAESATAPIGAVLASSS